MTPIAARLLAAASLTLCGLTCQQPSLSPDSLAPDRCVPSPRLEKGKHYALRIDHVATVPRPVVTVTLDESGAERPQEITQFLKPL